MRDQLINPSPETAPVFAGRRIGILGGSFNPAHEGHLHIALQARSRLNLDQVWLMVSPQNPLKDSEGMADFQARYDSAGAIAKPPGIIVTDIEHQLGTNLTVKTLAELKKTFKGTKFVWLMGADNLVGFHKWEGWRDIAKMVPIAVINRAPYDTKALDSVAAKQLRTMQIDEDDGEDLPNRSGSAWCFINCPHHPASATAIRAKNPDWAGGDKPRP